MNATTATPPKKPGRSGFRWLIWLVVLGLLVTGYFWIVLNWSYASGERAGWVQKFSRKGWICKTWEGELALVSLPGSTAEKFLFTVWDDEAAAAINQAMGKRVSLHYEQKVGLPTSCFGETRHIVTGVRVQDEIPLAPGVMVPGQPGGPSAEAASAARAASAASAASAP
jgi:hypothetical protein